LPPLTECREHYGKNTKMQTGYYNLSAFRRFQILKELRRFLNSEQDIRKAAFYLCQLLHGPMFHFECWVALQDRERKEIAWAFSPQALCARKAEKVFRQGAAPPCAMSAMESETGSIVLTDVCPRHCPVRTLLNGDGKGLVLAIRADTHIYGFMSVSARHWKTPSSAIEAFLGDLAGIVAFELLRKERYKMNIS